MVEAASITFLLFFLVNKGKCSVRFKKIPSKVPSSFSRCKAVLLLSFVLKTLYICNLPCLKRSRIKAAWLSFRDISAIINSFWSLRLQCQFIMALICFPFPFANQILLKNVNLPRHAECCGSWGSPPPGYPIRRFLAFELYFDNQ